jgi:hypothetical protein
LNEVLSLTDAMPDDNDVRQLYPHLCRALGLDDGFDPTNSSVRKSMVALLTEINHLLRTKYELVVRGYGNKNINYIRVPQTCCDDSFRNTKEWLDVAIRISGSKEGHTFNSSYRIANHLWRFYKDSVLAACETQRIAVCKPMTARGFAAVMKAAKITGMGEREVRKYLTAELGPGFWAFPIQFHQNQLHLALPETWGGSGSTRLGCQGVNCNGMGRFWSRHGFPDARQKIAWPKVT